MTRYLLNDASRNDTIFAGFNPNDKTGTQLRPAFQSLQQWAADINSMSLESVGATSMIRLSNYPGVDSTGTANSLAAVTAALSVAASNGSWVVVDCPIKLTIGADYTKPIFVHSGSNVFFEREGYFIVDNSQVPVFVFMHTTDCTWRNPRFRYVGNLPVSSDTTPANNFNNITLLNYLTNNFGNAFSGGGAPLWAGPTNACALIMIRGQCARLRFYNMLVESPQGANAANFCPVVVTCDPQWNPGVAVGVSTVATTSNATLPSDILFDGGILDGFYMGFVGQGSNLSIRNYRFNRYSDLQDSSGNNIGGVGQWFAPPHALYWGANNTFFSQVQVENCIDFGTYIGSTTRRPTTSGYINSLKLSLNSGSFVRNYLSYRAEGGFDCLSDTTAAAGGWAHNIVCVFDSSSTLSAGSATFGLRFPSFSGYVNMMLDNVMLIDTAVTPAGFPVSGNSSASNANCSITNLKVRVPDVPAGSTYWPGFFFAGNNINVEAEYYLDACNTTTHNIGAVGQQGISNTNTSNSSFDIKVFGWRPISSNLDGLKLRTLINDPVTSGTRARTVDVSNGYEAIVENGELYEVWAQKQTVTPSSGSSGFATSITFPSTFGLDRWGVRVDSALGTSNGLTTFGLGWSGAATALLSTVSPTLNTNPFTPNAGPVSLGGSNRTLLLTPTAGTFDGTGQVVVQARGSRFCVAGSAGTTGNGGGGVGTFTPLQHFSMETFAIGSTPVVTGGVGGDQLFTSRGTGGGSAYGGIITTAQHRASKTRSLAFTIQAGTSGSPGDGETPDNNGLWGYFLAPPSGTTNNYGAQGSTYHWGFWILIPNGVSLATNLTDGALKFMRYGNDAGAQKLDMHICQNFPGFALLNEFDPNNGTNNNYPSTRSPSNSPPNATIPQGVWTWVEGMLFLHSDGNQAKERIWTGDGTTTVLVLERIGLSVKWRDNAGSYHTQTISGTTGAPTLPTSSSTLSFMDFLSYWNNHPSVDTTLYIDDIVTAVSESSMTNVDNLGNRIIGSAAF